MGATLVAMTNKGGKYFISYSRIDSVFAHDLVNKLTESGIDIWMDTRDIDAGRVWDSALEDALRVSAGLIVVLTPASVDSPFVKKEIIFAQNNGKEIYPVLAEHCELPLLLADRQYADFTEDDRLGFTQLTTALKQQSSSPAQRKPTTTRIFGGRFRKGALKYAAIGLSIGAIYGLLVTLGLNLSGGGVTAIIEGTIVYGICGGLAGLTIPNRHHAMVIFLIGLMIGVLVVWVWAEIAKDAAINYTLVVGPLLGVLFGGISSRFFSRA